MSLKKKEFRNIKQRHYSVSDYIDEFTNLSRYTPDDIDTDAKRKEKFLEGLNDELSIPLSVAYTPTFQALLDQAIILENKIKQSENRKRKHSYKDHPSGSPQKKYSFKNGNGESRSHKHENADHHYGQHNYYHGINGNKQHGSNGHDLSGHKNHKSNNGSGNSKRNGHEQNSPKTFAKKDISKVGCFKCKEKGHYARDCPKKAIKNGDKPNPFKKGHINHVGMEADVEEVFEVTNTTTRMY
jgi:hypothetical protein